MNYIDTDKLIGIITEYKKNSLLAKFNISEDADYYQGKVDTCLDILQVITSLQHEQPEIDLEEALNSLDDTYFDLDDNFVFDEIMSIYDSNNCLRPRDEESLEMLEKVAHHFWNKGYNAGRNE